MVTRAECEEHVDYDETAALATAAFATPGLVFGAERLRWFYERCFSLGSTVIALRDEADRKVGQITMVRQTVMVGGRAESAAQLVDLFVSSQHRGKVALKTLYDEVEREFVKQDIRFGIGMPNAKAFGVNAHFFKLEPFLLLPFCMGVALPLPFGRDGVDLPFGPETAAACAEVFARFPTPASENGVPWAPAGLAERLSAGSGNRYAVHAVDEVMLISSPRRARGIAYTLLCGFFARPEGRASSAAIRRVVSMACRHWGRPVFAYAGVNTRLAALPGIRMPEKVRPSPMIVQLRDFKPERGPLRLDRFQVLDFDFG